MPGKYLTRGGTRNDRSAECDAPSSCRTPLREMTSGLRPIRGLSSDRQPPARSPIRAVLFDLDDTLVDRRSAYEYAYRRFYEVQTARVV